VFEWSAIPNTFQRGNLVITCSPPSFHRQVRISTNGNRQDVISLPILGRVVAIREAIAPGAALDGEAHFGLARAIAGSGGDHGRARALAERARAEYQQAMQLPVTLRVLAQIEAWLAAN